MNLARFNRYTLGDAVAGAQMRERTTHLRRRVESRAVHASYVINDLPVRLRDPRFLLKVGAGLAAVILLIAVYSSSSTPAGTAAPATSMLANPAAVRTTPTTAPVTTPATSSTTHRVATSHTGAIAHTAPARTTTTHPAPARSTTLAPTTTPAASTTHTTHTPTTSVHTPATTTPSTPATPSTTPTNTVTQTVTVTTPAPPTPAPAKSTTPVVVVPGLPAPGTMTEAMFKELVVNQITRGVIVAVFGKPATAKQLQAGLGAKWLTAASTGLAAGTSCIYYFDRSGKPQTFQLCFDTNNMLVRTQAIKDSTASGSA